MIEKTFAIDCDETIRSNIDEMVRIYNKEFGFSSSSNLLYFKTIKI